MLVSHWCVVVNDTRLQEWHTRYRRIVIDSMALTMTTYGGLNIPPPCSPRTFTIPDHKAHTAVRGTPDLVWLFPVTEENITNQIGVVLSR